MHLRHQADERVARVDVMSSGVMVTFRFAADKVVPKRERVRAPLNEVAPRQRQGFPESSVGKESTCNAGDLSWEDPLEKGKATHSRILAWRIPWTLWSMGLQGVGHD